MSAVRMLTGIPKEFQFGAEAERRIIRSYSSHPHHQICAETPQAPRSVLHWSWDVGLDRMAGRLGAKAARPTFGRPPHPPPPPPPPHPPPPHPPPPPTPPPPTPPPPPPPT